MSVVWLLSNKTPSKLLKAGLFVSTVIAVRLSHAKNAYLPMLMTPFPMATVVRVGQLKNAASPMPVTCSPVIVFVMTTSPPSPVYPVMVQVPSRLSA